MNITELGSRVGVYAIGQNTGESWDGLLINVLSKSETSIVIDIYSQDNDTESNVYYRYKSGNIETGTGLTSTELISFVDDIMHQVWVEQGVENYNISVNPRVVPTTVDYIVPRL